MIGVTGGEERSFIKLHRIRRTQLFQGRKARLGYPHP